MALMYFPTAGRGATATARSSSTPSPLPRASSGARTPWPGTRSISISGKAILSRPDRAPADESPQFDEPWQAEALALAAALQQAGRFSATEWAAALAAAIARAQAAGDPDDGSTYYAHVLDALERLVFEKSLSTRDLLAARKEAWRAA